MSKWNSPKTGKPDTDQTARQYLSAPGVTSILCIYHMSYKNLFFWEYINEISNKYDKIFRTKAKGMQYACL